MIGLGKKLLWVTVLLLFTLDGAWAQRLVLNYSFGPNKVRMVLRERIGTKLVPLRRDGAAQRHTVTGIGRVSFVAQRPGEYWVSFKGDGISVPSRKFDLTSSQERWLSTSNGDLWVLKRPGLPYKSAFCLHISQWPDHWTAKPELPAPWSVPCGCFANERKVLAALKLYRRDAARPYPKAPPNSPYPASLSALVPDYLDELPHCRHPEHSLRYRRKGAGFELDSESTDGSFEEIF